MTVDFDGRGMVPVCCPCGWDADGGLVLVDRWEMDRPPIPRVKIHEVYLSLVLDPDDRVYGCPACGEEFNQVTLIERPG